MGFLRSVYRCFLIVFLAGLSFQACGDSPPTGLDTAESFEELERGLGASGHLECRELVRDLWSRLGTLSRRERLVEVIGVARECVRGMRYGMLTVMTTTTGEGTDPDGYEVTLGSTTLSIPATGTVTFENVRNGRREVILGGLAPHCTVVGNPRQSDVVTPHRPGRVAFEIECGEGDMDHPSDELPYEFVSCPDLALTRSSGITLDHIEVTGFPAEFDPPIAARVIAGEEGSSTWAFLAEEGTETSMIVPMHPGTPASGGQVDLVFTDDRLACGPLEFSILPMPPAPGELAAIVDVLQNLVREQAALLGTTPEAIKSMPPEDVPGVFVPLAVVQSVLDHPGNPNSLKAISDGTAPFLDAEGRDLLDRLLSRTGMREGFDPTIDGMMTFPSRSLSLAEFGVAECAPGPLSAALLDFCMETSARLTRQLSGARAQILEDVMTAATIAGLAPHPSIEITASIVSGIVWLAQTSMRKTAAALPSSFTTMTLEYKPDFLEDEPGPGRWERAVVHATSQEWDEGRAALEFLIQSLVFGRAVEKYARELATTVARDAFVLLQTQVSQELLARYGTVWKIPPQSFGPVDVTDPMWSEARIAVGDAVELVSHSDYVPRKEGRATLSVRTEDGDFGGEQISQQAEIEVKQIQVHISPDRQFVEENEPLIDHFTVTVRNSKFPEMVEIDPEQIIFGSASIRYTGEGIHKVSYIAPPALILLPDFLTVRHTATTGARDPQFAPPERNAVAVIQAGDIEIIPSAACVEPGKTRQFQAVGVPADRVAWSEEGGRSISSTGLYEAPSGPADVLVIATSIDNPAVADTADVRVGDCSCHWSVTVDGTTVSSTPGDRGRIGAFPFAVDPRTPIFQIRFTDSDRSSCPDCSLTPGAGMGTAEAFVGPGTYAVRASGRLTLAGGNGQFDRFDSSNPRGLIPGPDTMEDVIMVISEQTTTSLIGTASGMVRLDGPDDDILSVDRPMVPFSADFAINAPPGVELGPGTNEVICVSQE